MLAYEIIGDGGIEQLALNRRGIRELGTEEVLVKIRASSINYRDLMTIVDPVPRGIVYPRIPNSDGAGVVEAIGSDVTRFKVGDRVCGIFMQSWVDGTVGASHMATALGGAAEGMLAEYSILNQNGLVSAPDELSFEEAAALPCAAVTAWNSLFEVGNVNKSSRVLLLGTGGVSIAALQFCKMVGAQAIITSSSDEKLDRAKALGASVVINYKTELDWDKKVLAETGGEGADHVVEVGGAGTLERSINATKIGGSIGLIGVLTGGTVNPTAIMRKSIKIQGIYVGSRKMFEDMNKAISNNGIKPVIDRFFDFENARDAYVAMQEANHFGKLVIRL